MKTIRTFSIAIMLLCAFNAVQAQTPVGLGVRLNPDGAGFDGKFFLDRSWAIEGELNVSGGIYGNNDGPSTTGVALLEYHIVFTDPSWRLYFGPGLHAGTWTMNNNGYYDYYGYYHNAAVEGIFGVDAILGLEYVFKSIPIGISADVQPAVNIGNYAGFFPNNLFGLSGRFYFGNRLLTRRRSNQVPPDNRN